MKKFALVIVVCVMSAAVVAGDLPLWEPDLEWAHLAHPEWEERFPFGVWPVPEPKIAIVLAQAPAPFEE